MMMRKRWIRIGFLGVALVMVTGSLAASTGSRQIQVHYGNIGIVIDGKQIQTANEPFNYEGRVYLPIRAVTEAMGAQVAWDAANNRVIITTKADQAGGPPPASQPPVNAAWRPFPDDNAWNLDISKAPVDPNSDRLIASIGLDRTIHPDFGSGYWNGGPIGMLVTEVPANQPKVPIEFTAYGDESDPGPYPIPPNAGIEGGPQSDGDRHVIVLDRANQKLYELYRAFPVDGGARWQADSGAVWDLRTGAPRPAGWTSADAAGLPIYPGLVRFDEVEAGAIRHALRFTTNRTRKAYVAPASHWASSSTSPDLPPMGMRVRLKSNVDLSKFSPRMQVIVRALQTYGMILADNGSPWYISGMHDPRWNDDELRQLKQLRGSDFEVVKMEQIVTGK
jgi:hypothetical protein